MDAYELADELLRDNTQLTVKAAKILRQQADQIAELEKQTKPLSDEEIDEILESLDVYIDTHAGVKLFARAIEERHGIK